MFRIFKNTYGTTSQTTISSADRMLVVDFVSACEAVKDLPYQNGDDDWNAFRAARERMEARGISVATHKHSSLFMQLHGTPILDILSSEVSSIGPQKEFSTALQPKLSRRTLHFTAATFIEHCKEVDEEWATEKFPECNGSPKLETLLKVLYLKQINVLEFLSTEDTDELLETCKLFRLFIHSLTSRRSHVIIDRSKLQYALGFADRSLVAPHVGTSKQIPPYPPNKWGVNFSSTDFLQWMVAAEIDIPNFTFIDPEGLESFQVLHLQCHVLQDANAEMPEFMKGHEPADGTPGAIVYEYLVRSTAADTADVDCELFFANVASNGDGEAFLAAAFPPAPGIDVNSRPRLMPREEAAAFVDALVKVNVADIARDRMRCSHCWADFDEVEEGIDNSPVSLPCDPRHVLGRDCLVEVLSSMGPLCPICRVDIVALRANSS
ncbi:hypothetical protein BDU57DRAFT_537017 [Ampelomyces quisqualis]|uniref:RING-type domain-containing protein n=1 Tax=Ampelomyces quisqualis TaxID=50730 RepID=A0A6A5QPM8_AMPQU|nr:hypothetical protein BDU57DRAFT_537017 [Ampelomyces quisqualis]